MPVKVSIDGRINIDTPFGDGSVRVWGPTDRDKDGDPEIHLKVDLPGRALDFKTSAEIPVSTFIASATTGAILPLAQAVLAKAGDVPGASAVKDLAKMAGIDL